MYIGNFLVATLQRCNGGELTCLFLRAVDTLAGNFLN